MISMTRRVFMTLAISTLASCSTLGSYSKPDVNITSFNLATQSAGGVPRFDIGLQIINPNSTALPLRGISYALDIEGQRILSGAKPDLPRIPAYGTVEFVIQATPDLLGSARLIADVLTQQHDSLEFVFRATLDPGTIMPSIRIEESGRFNLNQARVQE